MKFRMLLPIAFAAALAAQTPTTPGSDTDTNRFSQLQTYLGLSSSQLASLEQIRQSESQALRTLQQSLAAKEQALQTLLTGSNPDAAIVGQAMLDLQSTRQQLQQQRQQFRTQALAVLTTDQQTKLQALTQARQLLPDISQATALNLIDGGTSNSNGGPPLGAFGGRGGGFGPQWRHGFGQ